MSNTPIRTAISVAASFATLAALAVFFAAPLAAKEAQTTSYNPLTTTGKFTIIDKEFQYGQDNRKVPLRIYLPESESSAPVLLFSHGLGGSKDNNKYLGNHWAGRGYAVVVMQHAGSDTNTIKESPRWKILSTLKAAANAENAQARYADVKATLDYLESINRTSATSANRLAGRFDLETVGMSGHSFGAITTQAVSGQNFGPKGQQFTDKRIDAAVAFSPSLPNYGKTDDAFAKVKIPWLLMTGTEDKSPINKRTTAESRRQVFENLPKANHFYELVFDGGQHSAFGDSKLRFRQTRNPKHHPAIQAISTAFWDAYLKDDEQAKHWLGSPQLKQLLNPADVWQTKSLVGQKIP